MPKLDDKPIVNSIGLNDTIPLILDNGKIVRIKKTDLSEAIADSMRIATSEKNGLMSTMQYETFFTYANLPPDGINVVGNHDGYPGGYGWYNNSYSESDEFAPARSAGFFVRFNSYFAGARITFFVPSFALEPGKLWYRIDGGSCEPVK